MHPVHSRLAAWPGLYGPSTADPFRRHNRRQEMNFPDELPGGLPPWRLGNFRHGMPSK